MLHVGLTGGIASGKSTVAQMFAACGAIIVDLDRLVHDLYTPGGEVWRKIVSHFSPALLNEDQTIDRGRLGALVFADDRQREILNGIVHPAVWERWQAELKSIEQVNPRAIVLSDIPLLFETGMESLFSVVILVYIPPSEQLKRLKVRDRLNDEEARRRISSQMSIEKKRTLSSWVIDNSGSLEETRRQVEEIWGKLVRLAGHHGAISG